MSFFSILPRNGKYYDALMTEPVPLKVVQSNGVTVTPDVRRSTTELNAGYTNFHYSGAKGKRSDFKLTVIINKEDRTGEYTVDGEEGSQKVTTFLSNIIAGGVPVMVYTDAIDIQKEQLFIISNTSRKQTFRDYTEWELEFKAYFPITTWVYKNNNYWVNKAIKSSNKKTTTTKTTTTSASTNRAKLKKCKRSVLVYSKKQKTVTCVKYLQKVLKSKKYYTRQVDGWYGKYTVAGVKKFQKKYQKKYNIKYCNGKVDKKTFKALCEA